MEQFIGYTFKNPELLKLAFIHRSFGNENRMQEPLETRDNERLEFLGDAILDLIISQILLERFPDSTEGNLSKIRASLVNERVLAKIARDLNISECLLLGKGEEQTGGRDKDSILSNAFEAVVAAIFKDGGFDAANSWVQFVFEPWINRSQESESFQDYKTLLQELVQARYKNAPTYDVIEATGPDHDKSFKVQLCINNKSVAVGLGKSKKDAEQNAAKIFLETTDGKIE